MSAGAICFVWPSIATPVFSSAAIISSSDRSTRNPAIDCSLSSVPPVCPRPRPDIIGTFTPHAAASGASTSDALSPTPPVECLSTFTPGMADRSTLMPDRTIADVSHAVSSVVIPLRTMAMRSAEAW